MWTSVQFQFNKSWYQTPGSQTSEPKGIFGVADGSNHQDFVSNRVLKQRDHWSLHTPYPTAPGTLSRSPFYIYVSSNVKIFHHQCLCKETFSHWTLPYFTEWELHVPHSITSPQLINMYNHINDSQNKCFFTYFNNNVTTNILFYIIFTSAKSWNISNQLIQIYTTMVILAKKKYEKKLLMRNQIY